MRNAWQYLIVIIISIIAYHGALEYDIVKCDDNRIVDKYDTPAAKNQSYLNEFTQPYLNTTYYRPIVNISFKADVELYGKEYHKYHRTNLVLHALFCLLLLFVFREFAQKEYLALAATLVFAVHPMFANAVAWLPGRNDILLGIFGLASFIGFYKYLDTKKLTYLLLAAFAFMLALLSKETAIVLPFLFFLFITFTKLDQIKSKDSMLLYSSWLLAGLIWFILRITADFGENMNVFGISVFLSNLRVLGEFAAKFFIPVNLSVLPTYSLFTTLLGSFILLLFGLALYFIPIPNKKQALWGVLWFLLLLLPTTIFERANASEWNDYLYCRAYLPMVGLLISLIIIANKYTSKLNNNVIIGVGLSLVSALWLLNMNHAPAYKNIESFYNNAIEKDSSRAFFHEVIGVHYFKQKEFGKAMTYYENALKAEPKYYKRSFQVPQTAMYLKDFEKAIKHFQNANQLQPDNVAVLFSMATAYDYSGDLKKAIECYEQGLAVDTTITDAYFELLFDYQRIGQFEKYDSLSKFIISRKYQSAKASKKYDQLADHSFRNYDIDNAVELWKQAYVFDTTYIYAFKKITAAYYMQANADSCGKYYWMYRSRGGKFNYREREKFKNLINTKE